MSKVVVSGTVAELFEHAEVEGKGIRVKGRRCRWCQWTFIGGGHLPDHECSGDATGVLKFHEQHATEAKRPLS